MLQQGWRNSAACLDRYLGIQRREKARFLAALLPRD
jgi:hypothetical protein